MDRSLAFMSTPSAFCGVYRFEDFCNLTGILRLGAVVLEVHLDA